MAITSFPWHRARAGLWPHSASAALDAAWPYAGFLAANALTALAFLMGGGPAGWGLLPADGDWVTLVYARSFAQSLTFAYNPGVPEAGMTSPLWVMALGLLAGPLSAIGIELPALSQLLGVLLAAGVSAFAYLIVKRLSGMKLAGALAGFVIALDPTFAFAKVSGAEVAPFAVLSLGAIWALLCYKRAIAGLLLGLAVMVRPDGFALVGIAVAAELARRLWERERFRVLAARDAQRLVIMAAPALLAGAAWAAYNWSVTGMPLPNSYYVRAEHLGLFNGENLAAIWTGYLQHTSYLAGFQPVATVSLMAAGAWCAFKRAGFHALPLVVTPLVLIYGLSILVRLPDAQWDFVNRRYLDPLLPYAVILMALGAAAAWQAAAGYLQSQRQLDAEWFGQLRLTLIALALILVAVTLAGAPIRWARLVSEFSWSVRRVSETSIPMALWIDASLLSDADVGVTEPGALRYFARRPLIDLTGLSYHQGIGRSIFSVAEDVRVDYVIWRDDLYTRSWPYGNEIASIEAAGVTRLVAAESDWGAQTVSRHAVRNTPVEGLHLIDSLDVGDLAQELEHDWKMRPFGSTLERAFRTNPAEAITDDARTTTGYESFRVAAVPGKDLIIVKRYDAGVRGAVRVYIDNQLMGVWRFPAWGYFFGEAAFTIPGSHIANDMPTLRFEHIPGPRRLGNLNSFYYWFFVPE